MEKKDVLSLRQISGLMIMFAISETIASSCEPLHGNGTWLTFLISGVFTYFILFVYSYIMSLFPEQDIYAVLKILLGKFLSKVVGIVFIIFAIYVSYFALKSIVTFIKLVSLIETPIVFVGLLMVGWAAYTLIARGGMEAATRTVLVVLPIILIVYFGFMILLVPLMKFDHLLPLVTSPVKEVMNTSHMAYSNSSGDLVLFMGFLINPVKKNNRFKSFAITNTISMFILTVNSLFVTALLGIHIYRDTRYPTYNAYSLFNYGNFISRLELIISILLLICIVSKIAVGIYVGSKGCKSVFNTKDHRKWVIPLSVIVLFLGTFNHEAINFTKFNHNILWVKNIVQVGIPIIVAIILVIRKPKLISLGLIE